MKVFEENKSICRGIAEQVKQSISAERIGMAISIFETESIQINLKQHSLKH